jgi:hypothetical protein
MLNYPILTINTIRAQFVGSHVSLKCSFIPTFSGVYTISCLLQLSLYYYDGVGLLGVDITNAAQLELEFGNTNYNFMKQHYQKLVIPS